MGSNILENLWKGSYTYKVLSKLGGAFVKSLNNRMIISKLLRDEKIYGEDGLLGKISEKIDTNIIKIFRRIRDTLSNAISESFLISLFRNTGEAIISDIYRFILIVLGTGLSSYGLLSLIKGVYSVKKTFFIFVLGILPLIIGFLNIRMDKVFAESRFMDLVRKIFDYNS